MRRVLLLALFITGGFALTACPPKVKPGECKSSSDCAKQEGVGKVCVQGFCKECGQDSDCRDGFVCRSNQCVPKPQCTSDAECPADQQCVAERCVAKAPTSTEGAGAAGAGAVTPECADAAAFTIHFDFDKSTVTSEGQQKLQKLAECLKAAPAKQVTAEGYADERGTTQYNVALSGRRADAAKKYLGDLGVKEQVQVVPNGEDSPVCTESTEACWARNRRVEFQIAR